MTGRTLIIEAHGWRGFSKTGGPLGTVITMGWLSVSYLPFLLSNWLRNRADALRNVIAPKNVPPRAEMAAWGEDRPYHRVVPKGRT